MTEYLIWRPNVLQNWIKGGDVFGAEGQKEAAELIFIHPILLSFVYEVLQCPGDVNGLAETASDDSVLFKVSQEDLMCKADG